MVRGVSDDGPSFANRWPLLLGVLALAGVGIWWLLKPDPEPAPVDAPPPEEPAVEATPEDAPEPEPAAEAPPTDYDPDRLARILLDGGTAAEAEQAAAIYAPEPPTRGVAEDHEVAIARMEARAAEAPPTAAPREPVTPRQQLRQVEFWHGLLDQRTDAMREQIEAAEARGDQAAATRARRLLDRLEAQRPSLNRRLEELQDQVAAEDEAAGDAP